MEILVPKVYDQKHKRRRFALCSMWVSTKREKYGRVILRNDLPLYIEKLCKRFIVYSINKHYRINETIKLFGDTIDVRAELLPIWINDFDAIEGRFRKIVFALTRYTDARALLDKRQKGLVNEKENIEIRKSDKYKDAKSAKQKDALIC